MSELYALPEGWEWKELNNLVVSINSGFACSKKHEVAQGYIHLRTHNISTNGKINLDHTVCIPDEKVEPKKSKIFKNDILFNNTNSVELVGKTALVKEDANYAYSNHITRIVVDFSKIEAPYIVYYMQSLQNKKYFERICKRWIGQAGVNNTLLKKINIPLPPLQEQKRIVAKLDSLFAKIDHAIALHQQNIDEAEGFMRSVLDEVFGELEGEYEKRTLVSLDSKMSAGGTPLRKMKEYWDGDIPWYSSGELNQLYTKTSNEKITKLGLENSSAKLFPKGTLLIGMYDTAAMKMSILSDEGSCNQAIVGFNPEKKELNIFFAKYQLEYLKKSIMRQRQGVRQKNLNLTKLKNVEIEYPPLNIQQKTVQYLDRLSQKTQALKAAQQEKMAQLKALKASLLDRAFRGEL